jgi:hypothetical protein
LLIAAAALAQPQVNYREREQERQAIEQRFASSDPVDLAWGATLAANYGHSEFVPSIIVLLSSQDRWVPYYAFDALIRLNADVPEDRLLPYAHRFPQQILILLARDLERHRAALMAWLRDAQNDLEWVALNSVLMGRFTSAHAKLLWTQWTLHVDLQVNDPNRWSMDGGGFGCADGVLPIAPSGFPQVPYYFVEETLRPTGSLLAGGPHPLSYSSVRRTCKETGFSRDTYRLDYLRAMANYRTSLPSSSVSFHSQEQYRRDAEQFLVSVKRFTADLQSTLVDRGLLDKAEPQAKLEIVVQDMRSDRTIPLPEIEGLLIR